MTDHKTYYVKTNFLIDEVNYQLKNSNTNIETRLALISLLEAALFAAGSYAGYTYLVPSNLAEGVTPGIRYVDNKPVFEDTDLTRRHYWQKGT